MGKNNKGRGGSQKQVRQQHGNNTQPPVDGDVSGTGLKKENRSRSVKQEYKPNPYQQKINATSSHHTSNPEPSRSKDHGTNEKHHQSRSSQLEQGYSQEHTHQYQYKKCLRCRNTYDTYNYEARKLKCGHILCTSCVNYLISIPKLSRCLECQAEFVVTKADDLPSPNFSEVTEKTLLTEKSVVTAKQNDASSKKTDVAAGASNLSSRKSYLKGNNLGDAANSNLLECGSCKNKFNDTSQKPWLLNCEHSVCTDCMKFIIKKKLNCIFCQIPVHIRSIEDAKINYVLLDQVRMIMQNKSKEGSIQQQVVNVSSDQDDFRNDRSPGNSTIYPRGELMDIAENQERAPFNSINHEACKGATFNRQYHDGQERAPHVEPKRDLHYGNQERAPHKSRCLEVAVSITYHCATCQKWVCNECARIDHPRIRCFLVPKVEALKQMKYAQENGASAAGETIENTLTELHVYQKQLEAFSLTMQAAYEYVGKERERVRAMLQEGKGRKKDIDTAKTDLENRKNLHEALAGLQDLEKFANDGKQWTASFKALDQKRVAKTTKEILLSSVQMMEIADGENKAEILLLASQRVSEQTLLSHMTAEGGRIFVHCLEKMDNIPRGSRAIPLTSIKACLDTSKALTFLDISCQGRLLGRVLIRLVGDTFSGRQFLMMCTGEAGPSYRGTCFHRIWAKGCPGENIWGGDYENGNGSGGSPVLQISKKENSSIPTRRPVSIRAGLVAGSYGEDNPRTLFRIYTKDDIKAKKDSFPSFSSSSFNPKEVIVKDASAFGMVEYGLDVLDDALRHDCITDVVICSCGVVIETYAD